jgi:hypothetical protein
VRLLWLLFADASADAEVDVAVEVCVDGVAMSNVLLLLTIRLLTELASMYSRYSEFCNADFPLRPDSTSVLSSFTSPTTVTTSPARAVARDGGVSEGGVSEGGVSEGGVYLL